MTIWRVPPLPRLGVSRRPLVAQVDGALTTHAQHLTRNAMATRATRATRAYPPTRNGDVKIAMDYGPFMVDSYGLWMMMAFIVDLPIKDGDVP